MSREIFVRERQSVVDADGRVLATLANQIAWQRREGQPIVLAVGSRDQWHSSEPLPRDAVVTDLVECARSGAPFASDMWRAFLMYLYVSSKPSLGKRLLPLLSFGLVRPPQVVVRIGDRDTRAHVVTAIRKGISGTALRLRE